MKIINDVPQGSDQWLAIREKYNTASEAPAMMGVSPYMSRDELLRMKVSGEKKEVSDWVKEKLFANGHRIEAVARPIAEKIVGEELFPATAADDNDELLASFDGITMGEDIGWECKSWNEKKAAIVRENKIPVEDYWQVVQQLCVGVRKVLYMITDGTEENTLYVIKTLSKADRDSLLAGWKQFNADREFYGFVEPEQAPIAKAIKELPAINIQLVGEVKNSNLIAYREIALTFIKNINTDLQTDQDFADAEAMVKFCGNAENELESAKKMALAQTASIDDLFRTVNVLKEEMRKKRLELDKLVKSRKESIRIEIRNAGEKALDEHIATLNKRLGKPYLGAVSAHFISVMKGKKTVTSLRSAVNDELARAKIDANAVADRIEINLNTLREHAEGYAFLFADLQQILMKDNDDFVALIKLRIAEHKDAEEKRLEAEREQIRAEEQAKAEAEARMKLAAEAATNEGQKQETAEPEKAAAPAQAAAETPNAVENIGRRTPARPSDDQIIKTLAQYYNTDESTVMGWLQDMNLRRAS